MILDFLFTLLGLAVLLIGGDLLVRGAVGIAAAMRVPALFVSLSIVAFGTSAPELVTAVTSVLEGAPGLALGNIIGSNVANVLLVLGAPALLYPISAQAPGLRRHAVVLLAATAAFAAIAYVGGALDAPTGVGLLVGIAAYVAVLAIAARRGAAPDPVVDDVAQFGGESQRHIGAALLYLCAGLIGLPVGAHLLVDNGAGLAAAAGVRQELIGLTVFAIGTSLPELATVAAAALHKKSDVAIGSVLGSNIFNLLAVGGAAGLAGGAAFSAASLRIDLPAMAAAALALSIFVFMRRDIGRAAGVVFLGGYAAFLAALAASGGGS
jgi:cation:H+ antiporter